MPKAPKRNCSSLYFFESEVKKEQHLSYGYHSYISVSPLWEFIWPIWYGWPYRIWDMFCMLDVWSLCLSHLFASETSFTRTQGKWGSFFPKTNLFIIHPSPYHSAISSVFPVSSSLRGAVRSEGLPVEV